MIEHSFDDLDDMPGVSQNLWYAYVAIDYGRAVPEKGYKGYKTFLKDVTGADLVKGPSLRTFTLCFEDEEKYTWFLLKWS